MPNEKISNKQTVLLDTNILQYTNGSPFSKELRRHIEDLVTTKSLIAISKITISELLVGCDKEKENKVLETLKTLDTLIKFDVTETTLVGAARLYNFYKEYNVDKQASLADRIIATTSILTGAYVLTADINDFPRPLFIEIKEYQILYKKKNKTNLQIIQLLSPNYTLIQHLLETRR